jgi:hypothetical protein
MRKFIGCWLAGCLFGATSYATDWPNLEQRVRNSHPRDRVALIAQQLRDQNPVRAPLTEPQRKAFRFVVGVVNRELDGQLADIRVASPARPSVILFENAVQVWNAVGGISDSSTNSLALTLCHGYFVFGRGRSNIARLTKVVQRRTSVSGEEEAKLGRAYFWAAMISEEAVARGDLEAAMEHLESVFNPDLFPDEVWGTSSVQRALQALLSTINRLEKIADEHQRRDEADRQHAYGALLETFYTGREFPEPKSDFLIRLGALLLLQERWLGAEHVWARAEKKYADELGADHALLPLFLASTKASRGQAAIGRESYLAAHGFFMAGLRSVLPLGVTEYTISSTVDLLWGLAVSQLAMGERVEASRVLTRLASVLERNPRFTNRVHYEGRIHAARAEIEMAQGRFNLARIEANAVETLIARGELDPAYRADWRTKWDGVEAVLAPPTRACFPTVVPSRRKWWRFVSRWR